MMFWDGLVSGIASIGSALINGVSALASAVGGAVSTASHLLPMIPVVGPLGMGIRVVLELAVRVIPKVAEILMGKPAAEKPEELGMKAEKADFTLEDCNDTEEYIQRLRNEIHLDKKEVEDLNEEERAKYAIMGSELYIQSIEEHYGVKLGSEFLSAVTKADMEPERISSMILAMRDGAIEDGAILDRYLDGRLEAGSGELMAISAAYRKCLEAELKTSDIEKINDAILADTKNYRDFAGPEGT